VLVTALLGHLEQSVVAVPIQAGAGLDKKFAQIRDQVSTAFGIANVRSKLARL